MHLQPDASAFRSFRYLDRERWASYWHQIEAVRDSAPRSLLEIGPGNHIVADTLRKLGIVVTTCDIDPAVLPDIVAPVACVPTGAGAFECVLAAEILEHIPFRELPVALREICRISSRSAVITLPFPGITFAVSAKIPLLSRFSAMARIPLFWRCRPRFHEHHWEMGERGHSRAVVRSIIEDSGFRIVSCRTWDDDPYHCVFSLVKRFS